MTHFVRKTLISLTAASALVTGVALPAQAANDPTQDGLVNVAIGDITIKDINVSVVANVVAQVCGVHVGGVAVLGTAVDDSGEAATVCSAGSQVIQLRQN